MSIPAGQRNQFITIQAPPSGRDALGQVTGSWTQVTQVWARARPARSREFFAAGSMQAVADVVFGFPWQDGITSEMRVLWRGVPARHRRHAGRRRRRPSTRWS
jgi:SPP1 family predicted phage head-tail adaptor